MQYEGLLPICRYHFLSCQAILRSIHHLYESFHMDLGADEEQSGHFLRQDLETCH